MLRENVLKLIAIMENKGDCKEAGIDCLVCPLLKGTNECSFADPCIETMAKCRREIYSLIGKKINRITNDVNGNPRYLIHYLDLGLKTHESDKLTRKFFRKYNSKKYSGYFVFSSYHAQSLIVHYFKESRK